MTTARRWIATLGVTAIGFLALPGVATGQAHTTANTSDEREIEQVLVSAYINGMHRNESRAAARAGFHPDFVMTVQGENGAVRKVSIEDWIGRLPPEGTPPGREVTYRVRVLSQAGNAAAAQMDVFFDGEHVFTDFFGLYRLEGEWRIVNKIFQTHR